MKKHKFLAAILLFGVIGGIINSIGSKTEFELLGWLSSTAYSATALLLLYKPKDM